MENLVAECSEKWKIAPCVEFGKIEGVFSSYYWFCSRQNSIRPSRAVSSSSPALGKTLFPPLPVYLEGLCDSSVGFVGASAQWSWSSLTFTLQRMAMSRCSAVYLNHSQPWSSQWLPHFIFLAGHDSSPRFSVWRWAVLTQGETPPRSISSQETPATDQALCLSSSVTWCWINIATCPELELGDAFQLS